MTTIIDGSGSADFATPLPVTEGGTGASASVGSGSVMLSAQTGSAPVYGCRAWVNFNGTTGVINGSGNVSGVTRNSVGDYTITFTTALPAATYAVTGTCQPPDANSYSVCVKQGVALTTSAVTVRVETQSATLTDPSVCYVAIFV